MKWLVSAKGRRVSRLSPSLFLSLFPFRFLSLVLHNKIPFYTEEGEEEEEGNFHKEEVGLFSSDAEDLVLGAAKQQLLRLGCAARALGRWYRFSN